MLSVPVAVRAPATAVTAGPDGPSDVILGLNFAIQLAGSLGGVGRQVSGNESGVRIFLGVAIRGCGDAMLLVKAVQREVDVVTRLCTVR